jgi:hypothetical protein
MIPAIAPVDIRHVENFRVFQDGNHVKKVITKEKLQMMKNILENKLETDQPQPSRPTPQTPSPGDAPDRRPQPNDPPPVKPQPAPSRPVEPKF